jgi:hypothetical protein
MIGGVMAAKKSSSQIQAKQQTLSKFDQMLDAWRAGKEVGWSDLLAAWVEAPPAPRSPDLVIKVIERVMAK